MSTTAWHLSRELLQRYDEGGLDLVAQDSVETHLVGCRQCRAAASALVPEPEREGAWSRISSEIAEPELPRSLRALRRLGVPDADLVVLRASSSGLYRPWVLSVTGALLFAVLAGLLDAPEQDLIFLLVAPLVPTMAVVAAYDSTDAMREVAEVTALSKLRIALLRAAASAGFAVPLTLGVGLLVPGIADQAFLWLLPALMLTVLAMTLLTWWSARTTSAAVAGSWVVFVVALYVEDGFAALTSPVAQTVFAAAACALVAVFLARTFPFRPSGGTA